MCKLKYEDRCGENVRKIPGLRWWKIALVLFMLDVCLPLWTVPQILLKTGRQRRAFLKVYLHSCLQVFLVLADLLCLSLLHAFISFEDISTPPPPICTVPMSMFLLSVLCCRSGYSHALMKGLFEWLAGCIISQ